MIEGFEWDPGKAKANAQKHLVDFADAVEVSFDDAAVTVPDHHPHEERYATLRMDALGRILVVLYCWRAPGSGSSPLAGRHLMSGSTTGEPDEERL